MVEDALPPTSMITSGEIGGRDDEVHYKRSCYTAASERACQARRPRRAARRKTRARGRSNKTGRCRGNGSFVSADPAYFLRGGIWVSSAGWSLVSGFSKTSPHPPAPPAR